MKRGREATIKRSEMQETERKPFEKSKDLSSVGRKEISLKKTNWK